MGNTARKTGELPDTISGLTENEKNLIKSTWRAFCINNREYGVLLFLSLFVRHPEYLPMFRNFRANNVAGLKDDPAFRAHGCAVGYHLTSMVDNILDPATFEVLVRRNATEHLHREGVRPSHFKVMGEIVINVLQTKEERLMTPDAVDAWKKFLSYMVAIIADVFDKAAAELDQKQTKYSTARESTNSMDESALTVSSHVTAKGHEAGTARGGARKLQSKAAPKVISPSGKFSGLGSRGTLEDSAAAGFGKSSSEMGPPQPDLHASDVGQGGGAVGAKKDTTGPKEPSTVASLRDATVTSPQAEKTGTTGKSKRDKDWRDKNR